MTLPHGSRTQGYELLILRYSRDVYRGFGWHAQAKPERVFSHWRTSLSRHGQAALGRGTRTLTLDT